MTRFIPLATAIQVDATPARSAVNPGAILGAIVAAVALACPAMARPSRDVVVPEDLPLYSYHLLVPVVAGDGLCIRLGNWSGSNRLKVEWSDRKALLNLESKPEQTQQLDVPGAIALSSTAIVLYSDQAILPTIGAGPCSGDRATQVARVTF